MTTAEGAHPKVHPLLEVLGYTITFGPVKANQGVNFDVRPGEVHALVGENGAGKSTLLKLIYGVYQPDSGEVMAGGKQVVIGSPADARALGIGMVFQDLRLVPALTVAENIGLALGGRFRLGLERVAGLIRAASEEHGLPVDPDRLVRHLSIGERQRVEILKVLMAGARLVILDEPTSVLAPQEVDGLFAGLRELRQRGLSVIIITHKLAEARSIADKVTILRGGRVVVQDTDPADMTDDELVHAMVGHAVGGLAAERPVPMASATPALVLDHVTVRRPGRADGLCEVDLTVLSGEL